MCSYQLMPSVGSGTNGDRDADGMAVGWRVQWIELSSWGWLSHDSGSNPESWAMVYDMQNCELRTSLQSVIPVRFESLLVDLALL